MDIIEAIAVKVLGPEASLPDPPQPEVLPMPRQQDDASTLRPARPVMRPTDAPADVPSTTTQPADDVQSDADGDSSEPADDAQGDATTTQPATTQPAATGVPLPTTGLQMAEPTSQPAGEPVSKPEEDR